MKTGSPADDAAAAANALACSWVGSIEVATV
jgi:hypothetical protein